MEFREYVLQEDSIEYIPVKKADICLATKKDIIHIPGEEDRYKKKEGFFLVQHPQNKEVYLYIRKKAYSTLKRNVNSKGVLGFYYEMDKNKALDRSRLAQKVSKHGASRRNVKASRTKKLNK